MLDRVVKSGSPSSSTAEPSWTITAALPLSHTSLIRVPTVPLPDVGSGRCSTISWLPWTTWARSMSQPGRSSDGGSVSWKVGATTPNDGSTWRSRVVEGVAQGAGVEVVARARAEADAEVVEQHVGLGPGEGPVGKGGADRLARVDGHVSRS